MSRTRTAFLGIALVMTCTALGPAVAATVTSSGSGAWEAGGTWSSGSQPGSADDVYIQAGHTVTINGLATNQINSLTITGTLTHADNSTTEAHKVCLDVTGDLTVAAGGTINVTGLGYNGGTSSKQSGFGPGAGHYVGGAYKGGGGGGHGGEGGDSNGGAGSGGTVYGSLRSPIDLGSGGAAGNNGAGGAGGGAVKLAVGANLTIDGTISANGANGASRGAGGSGGSVWLVCDSITGSGAVTADAGNSGNAEGGGGGGGRISCLHASSTFSGTMSAFGGAGYGSLHGGAGTIYTKASGATNGALTVDNNDQAAAAMTLVRDQSLSLDSLTVTNFGKLGIGPNATLDISTLPGFGTEDANSRLVVAGGQLGFPASYTLNFPISQRGTNVVTFDTSLTIGAGGMLTHEDNTTEELNRLNLIITGHLDLQANGRIDVDGLGYNGATASRTAGFGPGAGQYVGGSYQGGGGAGHGGEGGDSLGGEGSGGVVYGSIDAPVHIGSGGAEGHPGYGGDGGGAIKIMVASNLTVNGTITANGTNGTSRGGGGSGGSVWLVSDTFQGSGAIRADGGRYGGSLGGGGAGGRISCVYTSSTFSGSATAYGDDGRQDAAAGTVCMRPSTQAGGDLTVDNDNRSTAATTLLSPDVAGRTFGGVVVRRGGHLRVGTNQALSVYGSWSNAASFSAQPGAAVALAGSATATVWGDTAFDTLSCTNAGKTLNFEAGGSNTVSGSLTFSGQSGSLLDLNATASGTHWYLNLLGGALQSVSFVEVEDSNATGDPVVASDSVDVNNNVNWVFAGGALTNTWQGDVSTDWGTSANWDQDHIPGAADTEVRIPNGAPRYPVLDADRIVDGDLVIESTASLDLDNHGFRVGGAATIAGALTARGSEAITFMGDVDLTGSTFTEASSTVVLGGVSTQSVITAGRTLNAVSVTNGLAPVTFADGLTSTAFVCETADASLTFDKDSTYVFNDLRLIAPTNHRITLRSTQAGQRWDLRVTGWSAVRGADVQDSDASGGPTVHAVESIDSGNNLNWDFSAWSIWDGSESSAFDAPGNWVSGQVPDSNASVLVDGDYVNVPIVSSDATIGRLTIASSRPSTLVVDTSLTVSGDVTVLAGGTLTHSDNATTANYKLVLTVGGHLSLDAGAVIDVDGLGYNGATASKTDGFGPGAGQYVGGNYQGGGGAGHGGEGGESLGGAGSAGAVYDSLAAPAELGSGGAEGHPGWGGSGGGAVKLAVASNLTLNGTITADGTDGISRGGGGSGGSVWLACASFVGSGAISARGGSYGGSLGGGGAGGRIAVTQTSGTSFGSVQFDAEGNLGYTHAAGGTIYLKPGDRTHGTLVVDNHGTATSARTLIDSNVTDTAAGSVEIRAGGRFGLAAGETLQVFGSWSNAGAFAPDAGTTVELAGTDTATLAGDTVFSYLACTTANKRIDFQAGDTFTVSNGLTFAGAAGATNDLNSTTPGTQWYLTIVAGAAQSVSYCAVQDSNADGGDSVATSDCRDDGNNSNWVFDAAGPIVWTGAIDSNWGTGGNWDQGRTPIPTDTQVIIPNVVNQPVLDSDRGIGGDLIIQTGASLTCGGRNLTVSGDADIDGTLAATASEAITFAGDADFSGGAFVKASSRVVLGGASSQSFTSGGALFNDLAVSNITALVTFADGLTSTVFICEASDASLVFDKDSVYAFTGFKLIAPTNHRITLRSTQAGQSWRLKVSGWNAVRGVDVQDSDASGGQTVYAMQSVDSGNNLNWDFSTWYVWDGSESSAFATPGNWVGDLAPDASARVLIDGNYANAPVISSDTTVRRLAIAASRASAMAVDTNLTVTEDAAVFAGGTLTHSDNATTAQYKLNLTVGGNLAVHAGAAIDVDELGYNGATSGKQPGFGPGAGQYVGGNYMGGGGAGHGGEGGDSLGGAGSGGTVYGSLRSPTDLGSGGAEGNAGAGGAGGGAVKLVVGTNLTVNGTISANGARGTPQRGGGGSGGSVWVVCNAFQGTGTITANGGSFGTSDGGAGGGGRISCVYTSSTFSGTMAAFGGLGHGSLHGAAGTIYTKASGSANGALTVDNSDQAATATTLIRDQTLSFDSLTLTNYARLGIGSNAVLDISTLPGLGTEDADSRLVLAGGELGFPASYALNFPISQRGTNAVTFDTSLTIADGGMLTHEDNATAELNKLNLTITGSLTIESNGLINVDGLGYNGATAATQPGFGPGAGQYVGGLYMGGGGAGHGGEGGDSLGGDGSGGTVYGAVTAPTTIGSGGAEGNAGWGGAGGGAVKLVVASSLTVDGLITANGTNGISRGGGGSGGSVWLECESFQGSGAISAKGGKHGGSLGGGGAGGRVAVVLTGSGGFGGYGGSMATYGSVGQTAGAAGTIYMERANGDGSVVVDNNGLDASTATTRFPPDIGGVATELETASLIATNYGEMSLSTNAWVGDILVYPNSFLTLGSCNLYVDSTEHSLEDTGDRSPGATNRVDRYDHVIWIGQPDGTVFLIR